MNIQNKLRIALPSKGRLRTDMESLFEEKKIIFALTHNYSAYPMLREAKELVKEGNLKIKQDKLFDSIYIKET